jgi:threonine aldolase
MAEIRQGAAKAQLPIHLDGARLFNAAVCLAVKPSEIADLADSVCFCLSKGLGAPVGSLVCGPSDFIQEAFFKRKIMGGGMRQAGIIAAAGLVALDEELPRLEEDHLHARQLASAFCELKAFDVLTPKPDINMVFLRLKEGSPLKDQLFLSLLKNSGILTYPPEGGVFRFVTHRDVTPDQIAQTLQRLPGIARELAGGASKAGEIHE